MVVTIPVQKLYKQTWRFLAGDVDWAPVKNHLSSRVGPGHAVHEPD